MQEEESSGKTGPGTRLRDGSLGDSEQKWQKWRFCAEVRKSDASDAFLHFLHFTRRFSGLLLKNYTFILEYS